MNSHYSLLSIVIITTISNINTHNTSGNASDTCKCCSAFPFKKARYLAKNFTIHQKPHVAPTLKDESMHV